MIESLFKTLQQLNRKHLHLIWQRARKNELNELTEDERRLAEVMLAHSEEYFNQFEFADLLVDHDFDPEKEVNPFFHIVLHVIAEKQVEDRNPIEAFQFYNAMLKKKCSRHEAIHLIMAILIYFLFPVLQRKGKFKLDTYRQLLRNYKWQKPEKITSLLEKEPHLAAEEPGNPKTARIFDELRSVTKEQEFQSIEEVQTFANAFMNAKNREPLDHFLGLSPEQMQRLLYRPQAEVTDIVTLNKYLSHEELMDIPVVKEVVYFLKRLSELQPLKATATGNLPRAFAQEIHDQFPDHYEFPHRIMSENEDWKLMSLRYILDLCGWCKKQNQRFSLTRNGQKLIDNGFAADDFYHLLEIYMRKFNWTSRDHYPELTIIQQAALFSCYLLHLKARAYTHTDDLSQYFIQAFPAAADTVPGSPFETPEKTVQGAFSVRFIERFGEYFGLVEVRREKKGLWQADRHVKITPLFEKIFQWQLSPPGNHGSTVR